MRRTVTILKSQFFKQGGAEKYAHCLAEALFKKGHLVRVLTTGDLVEQAPFEVISHPLKSKMSVSKTVEFDSFCEKFLQSHPSEIVLGLDRNQFQTHLRAGSGAHRAYLEHRKRYEPTWKKWRHFFNPLHSTLLKIEKKGFEHPDLKVLFTNSYLVKKEILNYFVLDPDKIAVIHNGVEWQRWEEPFQRWEDEKDPSHFHFLFIGNDFTRKGLIPLLKGLKHLAKYDFHLSVVGKDKRLKKFQFLAQKLGLENKVTFWGLQSDVRPFLQKADCLVIPSYYDPFANVTVEALAMGLFVISSKTNGGHEILTPETGMVVENLNEGMEEALLMALKYPKTPLSAKKIRHSVKHLDFSIQLNAYLEKMQC